MALDDNIPGNAQAEAGPLTRLFCRKEWFKYPFNNLGLDGRSIIGNFADHMGIFLLRAYSDFSHNIYARFYRVGSVGKEIQEYLIDLAAVTFDLWNGPVVLFYYGVTNEQASHNA